jgi:ABC-type tungstate transport system substrate-binding protein
VVRALRHHGDLAAPRLPAVELGLLLTDVLGRRGLLGSFGLFFTLFSLFVRFLPMIAIAEVKTVVPEADPHHHPELNGTERPGAARQGRRLTM